MRRKFRGELGHRRRVRQVLKRAHQAMEARDFEGAAGAFEQLAVEAEGWSSSRSPIFFLEAGRAHILAGHPDRGLPRLRKGLELLAAAGRWPRMQRAGQRLVAELNQQGLSSEARDLTDFLVGQLPEGFGLAQAPGYRQRPVLPVRCPSCGGPVEPDVLEWVDENTAECDYCGSPIRAQE